MHKLGAPGNPELAIGSVDEAGHVFLHEQVWDLGIDETYIEHEKKAQLKTLHKRRTQYTPVRPPLDPAGRIVIVVDNGIATGASMIAALRAARAQQPAKLTPARRTPAQKVPPRLDAAYFAKHNADDLRIASQHFPKQNRPAMPHFSSQLSADEVMDIVHYLRTLPPAP